MEVSELDTFVQKFKQLWYSGLTAHLDLDTHAGQAWVGVRVRLGHAPGPLHIPPHFPSSRKTRDGPSRQRRRVRRAAFRRQEEAEKATKENENAENVLNLIENETDENVSLANPAGTADSELEENAIPNNPAEEAAAEKAPEVLTCDLCDLKFSRLRGLRTHVGKKHGSTIPQIDGASDISESVAYTFKSEFADEDIMYTFGEILSDAIETKLVSRVRLYGPRSAVHLCTIRFKLPPDFQWPEMSKVQAEVIKELMIEQKEFPA